MRTSARVILTTIILLGVRCVAADAPEKFAVSELENSIVELANAERVKNNLPPVKIDPKLFAAARDHATNMAKQDKLEHHLDGKGHSERIDAAGYSWSAARENIAFNQRTAQEVHDSWMQSEGHRRNILADNVTEIGVGTAKDSKGQIYFVQLFAKPQAVLMTLRFSIENTLGVPITVDVGTTQPAKIEANGKTNFTLNTSDNPAMGKVTASGMNEMSFQFENGAAFRIGKNGSDFSVSREAK